MKLSIVIPTIRPPEIYAKDCIRNVKFVFKDFDWELIFVGPKTEEVSKLEEKNIFWVNEPEGNIGSCMPCNLGYKESTGDLIFLGADDHHWHEQASQIPSCFDPNHSNYGFKDRKLEIIGIRGAYGNPSSLPDYCEQFNIAPFIAIERETIETYMQGYVYNPHFKMHYFDNWLGYWLGKFGEPILEVGNSFMWQCENCGTANIEADNDDEALFKHLIMQYELGINKDYAQGIILSQEEIYSRLGT